jgi:hypothetical protein
MTIAAAMWPLPLTSFHSSFSAEPQLAHVLRGGYWSLSQAAQRYKTSRFSFTASQKGWLNASDTGITFGICPLRSQGGVVSEMPHGRLSLPSAGHPWGGRSMVQVVGACQSSLASAWEMVIARDALAHTPHRDLGLPTRPHAPPTR